MVNMEKKWKRRKRRERERERERDEENEGGYTANFIFSLQVLTGLVVTDKIWTTCFGGNRTHLFRVRNSVQNFWQNLLKLVGRQNFADYGDWHAKAVGKGGSQKMKQTHYGGFANRIRFDFRKGPRQGFDRAGSKYTRTCANRKFVLQTENWFSGSFSVRPVPMAKRLGTFKKILAETLLLSSHEVTKWSWRGRTSFFFFLPWHALQGSAGRERGSSRTVLHEGE